MQFCCRFRGSWGLVTRVRNGGTIVITELLITPISVLISLLTKSHDPEGRCSKLLEVSRDASTCDRTSCSCLMNTRGFSEYKARFLIIEFQPILPSPVTNPDPNQKP